MPDSAITVHGLQKRFGDVVALDGVDFEVPPATVFGLLGPNGAGKTTAVRVLTTILRPDAGQATVLGLDVADEPERVRAHIGLAGQDRQVLAGIGRHARAAGEQERAEQHCDEPEDRGTDATAMRPQSIGRA